MVICTFCGHLNPDGSGSCEKCKTDLSTPAAPETGPQDPISDTLQLEKVPLVHSLGLSSSHSADMTRPAGQPREPVPAPQLPFAVTVDAGAPAGPALEALSQDCKPRLVVLRGEKINMNYPLYAGKNYLGRTDEKPVDIDLENQEPADRIWTSRQHAVVTFENGLLTIEDLNSLNGTFVNRTRVYPGQVRTLQVNDIIQVGTVQMRVVLS